MNTIYKVFMTLSSTSWLLLIYFAKEKTTLFSIPYQIFDILFTLGIVFISFLTLKLSNAFGTEKLQNIHEITLADNEFLPTYLGYFFVALSIPSDLWMLIIVYGLVFIFSYLSIDQYFNPVLILFGYHFYKVKTSKGTNLFVISRGTVIRNSREIDFDCLRRINDTTFINSRKG
ncbi:hypothetical protein [Dubosiella newyorkensis]|uniref:hypothetical protein n=1 Tax=Dubosiella newyorkensis TaxID=1862672 RepID=UPI0032B2D382